MKISFISTSDEKDKIVFFELIRPNTENNDDFGNDYKSSIGVNIFIKLLYYQDDQIARLILWDINPEKFFKWVRPLFYKGSIGSILIHSDNSDAGVAKTLSIIDEFDKNDFFKILLILHKTKEHDNDTRIDEEKDVDGEVNNIIRLKKTAEDKGFECRIFELKEDYEKLPESFLNMPKFWRDLRIFYENALLDLFCHAVRNLPGNKFNINGFRSNYFSTLNNYEYALKEIYKILDELNLKHDYKNIYVNIKEGLFSVNIFSSACYYHYPNKEKGTKYICMEPKSRFLGWSNNKYLPKTFLLALSKVFYLMEGHYDSVVKKQLKALKS
ncbi:MAG: hypothetical protein ACTSXF_08845 [Promethearchaeota archaeon]